MGAMTSYGSKSGENQIGKSGDIHSNDREHCCMWQGQIPRPGTSPRPLHNPFGCPWLENFCFACLGFPGWHGTLKPPPLSLSFSTVLSLSCHGSVISPSLPLTLLWMLHQSGPDSRITRSPLSPSLGTSERAQAVRLGRC